MSRKFSGGRAIGRIHTAAHVEENGDAHRGSFGPEFADRAALAAIDHLEILLRQVLHESPFVVPDRGAHRYEIHSRPKCRLFVSGLLGPPRKGHQRQSEGLEDPPHAPSITKFLAKQISLLLAI